MAINEYLTVKTDGENEIDIERSRFIGYVKRVSGEDEAKQFVESIKKKNSLATHNCYAFIADENASVVKFSDDGEPQGTAGMPILEVLKNKKLRKIAVVVTRYFGGIKLGAGGLVRAYTRCAAEALEISGVVKVILSVRLRIKLSYVEYPKFQQFLSGKKYCKLNVEYGQNVTAEFLTPFDGSADFIEKFNDYFLGKVAISRLNDEFAAFEE